MSSFSSTYQRDEALEQKIKSYVLQNNLTKKCWYPGNIKKEDTIDTHTTKIGGKRPHLPTENIPPNHSMLMQLYIPMLPDEMKAFFPEAHQKSLLVVMIDRLLHGADNNATIRLYSESQLDQLIYEEDNINTKGIPLNRPVQILNWVESFQVEDEKEIKRQFNYTYFGSLFEEKQSDQVYLGGYKYVFNNESAPNDTYKLFMNFGGGRVSSDHWGDCGTGQLYMTIGEDFGSFYFQHSE